MPMLSECFDFLSLDCDFLFSLSGRVCLLVVACAVVKSFSRVLVFVPSPSFLTIDSVCIVVDDLRFIEGIVRGAAAHGVGKRVHQDIAPTEARETLKELLSDLVRRSWNATRFMEYGKRADRQRDLRTLCVDEKLVVFDPKAGPTVDFS